MNERSTGDSDVSPHELTLTESKSQTLGVPPTTQQNKSSALVRSSIPSLSDSADALLTAGAATFYQRSLRKPFLRQKRRTRGKSLMMSAACFWEKFIPHRQDLTKSRNMVRIEV